MDGWVNGGWEEHWTGDQKTWVLIPAQPNQNLTLCSQGAPSPFRLHVFISKPRPTPRTGKALLQNPKHPSCHALWNWENPGPSLLTQCSGVKVAPPSLLRAPILTPWQDRFASLSPWREDVCIGSRRQCRGSPFPPNAILWKCFSVRLWNSESISVQRRTPGISTHTRVSCSEVLLVLLVQIPSLYPLFLHSFFRQVFIKCPRCTRDCTRHWVFVVD